MSAEAWIALGALVLQTLVLGATGLIFLMRLQGKQDKDNEILKLRLAGVESGVSDIKKSMTLVADQSVRLNFLEKMYEELRRGRGWVTADVHGEYLRSAKIRT